MLDAYRDLIDDLLGTPSEIRTLIDASGNATVSPVTLLRIAELRDRDRAVLERAQVIVRQENPYLSELHMPEAMGNHELMPLMDEMDTARGDLVSLLINLSLKDWERSANHETEGEVTLSDEIEQHVEFDEAQRRRIRESLATS